MNKFTLLIASLFFFNLGINAQEIVVAGWTFPNQSAEADTGVGMNNDAEIFTIGGTSEIEFKNGLETKAAQASAWNDGMDLKAWVIEISTSNFQNLSISSIQQSGGNDPGPKDFILQYSVEPDVWVNITDGVITVENDWTTSAVENLPLPEACNDMELIKIRWLMASNEASGSGGAVLETGKSKIDNIFVRGELINGINNLALENQINVYPNPTDGLINLETVYNIEKIQVLSVLGQVEKNFKFNARNENIDLMDLPGGNYFLKIKIAEESKIVMKKITIL